MARVKGTVISTLWELNGNSMFPLRFLAPIKHSHPLVPPDQYPGTPLFGATQTCATLDEGQGAQYHVLSRFDSPTLW